MTWPLVSPMATTVDRRSSPSMVMTMEKARTFHNVWVWRNTKKKVKSWAAIVMVALTTLVMVWAAPLQTFTSCLASAAVDRVDLPELFAGSVQLTKTSARNRFNVLEARDTFLGHEIPQDPQMF